MCRNMPNVGWLAYFAGCLSLVAGTDEDLYQYTAGHSDPFMRQSTFGIKGPIQTSGTWNPERG